MGGFRLKTSGLRRNFFADGCGRELFKLSKDSASLRVCYEKIFWF